MNAEEQDEIYSEICHRMTAAGEEGALLYLSRLTLLLAHEVDSAERIRAAVQTAATASDQ
ncbi:hypothetical protein ABZ725_37505 [Streptomyces sp. NPDC006872]|uniref:hypothetical protein n=1 Tax=Streptomyces sp. NPDC006872 TaxID=3155720 RepID=UPI0033D0877A